MPIGLGSILSESFSSYIARLAEVHEMSVGRLIDNEIAPILGKKYILKYVLDGGTGFYKSCHIINGYGDGAKDFYDVLSKLTLRKDIRFLTLLSLKPILTHRGLLVSHRRWCSYCFEEQKKIGVIIYEPLLWSINEVSYCPIHESLLRNVCPECGKSQWVLSRGIKVGFCSKCGVWLGENNINHKQKPFNPQEYWNTIQVSQLLGQMPYIRELSNTTIPNAFKTIIDDYHDGNMAEFGRSISSSKSSVWGWLYGENLPSLRVILKVSYLHRISLLKLIGMPEPCDRSSNSSYLPLAERQSAVNSLMEFSLEYPALNQPIDTEKPQSLDDQWVFRLLHRIGFHPTVKKIKKCLEVIGIVRNLGRQGLYPSRRRIERHSSKKSLLRSRECKTVWHLLKK